MAERVKLIIRPPPHSSLIRAHPGIPASQNGAREAACISGTIEVRPKTAKGVKALWLRIELKKLEVVSAGGKATSRFRDHVGPGPVTLWQAHGVSQTSADPAYGVLQTSDFAFHLPLPEDLPPSVQVDRRIGTGIVYELVVTLMAKPKSGLFGASNKQPEPVIEHLAIGLEKHEHLSGWPIYTHQARTEDRRETAHRIVMHVKRSSTAFGPGDGINVNVKLKSDRLDPVKFSHIELFLREVITFRGDLKDMNQPGQQQMATIVQARFAVDKIIYPQDEIGRTVRGIIPRDHPRVTVSTAQHLSIAYHIGVRAVLERERGTVGPISDMLIDHMPTVVCGVGRERSEAIIAAICATGGEMPPDLCAPRQIAQRASWTGSDSYRSDVTSDPSLIHSGRSTPQPFAQVDENGRAPRTSTQLVSAAKERLASSRKRQSMSPTAQTQPTFDHASAGFDAVDDHQPVSPPSPPAFRITNQVDDEAPQPYLSSADEKRRLRERVDGFAPPSPPPPPPASATSPTIRVTQWPSAVEEKRRYAEAIDQRDRESAAPGSPPDARARSPASATDSSSPTHNDIQSPSAPHSIRPDQYASAEEEKARLYQDAVGQRPSRRATGAESVLMRPGVAELEKAQLYHDAVQDRESYRGPYSNRPTALPDERSAVDAYQQAVAQREQWQQQSGASSSLPVTPPRVEPAIVASSSALATPQGHSLADTGESATRESLSDARHPHTDVAPDTSLHRSSTYHDERLRYQEAIALRDKTQAKLSVSPPRSQRPMPTPSGGGGSPKDPPPAFASLESAVSGIATDKEQMRRYYAAQDSVVARQRQRETLRSPRTGPDCPPEYVTNGGELPHLGHPLPVVRSSASKQSRHSRPASIAEGSENSFVDSPRDPSIALGKRRADPPPTERVDPSVHTLRKSAPPSMVDRTRGIQPDREIKPNARAISAQYGRDRYAKSPTSPTLMPTGPPRPPKTPVMR